MVKNDLVAILEEMSLLMEINGANEFKIRAIAGGARTLDKMDIDIAKAVGDGSLSGIAGIGKGLQALISEFVRTETIQEWRDLKSQVPVGVLQMTELNGIGGKKARLLHDQLGIDSIGELEYACRENRLVDLKGFGQKTQAATLKAIELWNASRGLLHYAKATLLAAVVVQNLQKLGATQAKVSGEIRASEEVISSIDIVAVGPSAEVVAMELKGHVQGSVVHLDDTAVPIRIHLTTEELFGTTLFRTTGSQEFVTAVESISPLVDSSTESTIFASRKLQFVPPELRFNVAILERARENTIPVLVENQQMRGMLHIHTKWSDGVHSIRDMALESKRLGFEYVAICDHSQTAVYAHGLSIDRVLSQHEEIEGLRKEELGIEILKGIESDILTDGSLDYPEEILALFDIVVASVHSNFRLPKSQQTQRIVDAIRNPFTTILGHPTGRLLLTRNGYDIDVEAVIEAASETGTVIELNANPYRFDLDWRWHQRAVERGVKIAINPDSHEVGTLAEVFMGVGIARRGMLRPQDVINTLTFDEFQTFCREQQTRKR